MQIHIIIYTYGVSQYVLLVSHWFFSDLIYLNVCNYYGQQSKIISQFGMCCIYFSDIHTLNHNKKARNVFFMFDIMRVLLCDLLLYVRMSKILILSIIKCHVMKRRWYTSFVINFRFILNFDLSFRIHLYAPNFILNSNDLSSTYNNLGFFLIYKLNT